MSINLPSWAFWALFATLWVLLGILYQLWEQRCPRCKSWATRKASDTTMRCSSCHHTFDF